MGIPKECLEKHKDGDPCGCRDGYVGYWDRQNTQYNDSAMNYFFGCEECHEENDAHW